MITFKNVCLDYRFPNKTVCNAQAGDWLTPSFTKENCEKFQGI